MRFEIILGLSLALAGCWKKHREKPVQPNHAYSELKAKYDQYFEMTKNFVGAKGQIYPDTCDSLLWTGLYMSLPGTDVQLDDYELSPGRWLRRPIAKGNCWPNESASEISRDMILGLMWGIYERSYIDKVNETIKYGDSHDWVMGEGDPFRTVLSPDLAATLYAVLGKLTDIKYAQSDIPLLPTNNLRDYEAHLGILHVLLRGKVFGYITDYQLSFLRDEAARNPHNTLMQIALALYTTGEFSRPVAQLLEESHFPLDHLPTNREHCEPWLWQREMGPDWKPCDIPKQHSGADFLFASWLILSKVNQI